jgi:hypothetical protein
MVIHKCERCKTIWTKKSNFLNHLKRKNKCPIVDEIEEVKGDNDEILIEETKPKIIAINGKHYYNADDLKNYDPVYFKSCSNSRKILEKVDIPKGKYIFASYIDGSWEMKDETYKRAKLLIRNKFVLGNVPKMIPNLEKDKVRKMYDVEVAPDILNLDGDEKFKNIDGDIIEIEVRGEREYDKCYFRVDDISLGFEMKNIQTIIKHDPTVYVDGVHYKYFNTKKKSLYEENENKNKPFVKKMFLTYKGLIRLLYCSRSKNAEHFQDWATKILFTHQMGMEEDKDQLSASLLGVSSNTIKEVFRTCSNKTPVVYLFCIGQAKKLLKDDSHLDNILLCKFGCTEDISRRTTEHENNFKKEYGKENMNFSLLLYSIIDPQYIFEAEMGVKDYFKTDKLVKDGKSETVLIDKNNISKIRQYYKMVQNQYIGRYKEMNEIIKKLEKKLENEKHQRELSNEKHLRELENEKHQRELENDKHQRELENEKHQRELENAKHQRELENEKHNNEILRMKLEIMGLKCGIK